MDERVKRACLAGMKRAFDGMDMTLSDQLELANAWLEDLEFRQAVDESALLQIVVGMN